uniref:Uncharacterized protein n=1 Tax=Ananas comosus var. bracteatus TaxID=296719 RepID=A0A6V7Q345_ANACO|nr:unnamed protein product [Ananas comosus var. bracteatus]
MTSTSKYPYPCNLNVANFVSLKLTTTNYLLWETQVLSLIESQDLLGFITGESKPPHHEVPSSDESSQIQNPDFTAWTRTDCLVKAWITGTLSEEVLGLVVGVKTSADVWQALADAISQNSQAREFELLSKLQYMKKGMSSLSEYLREFKSICDQLNAIGKPVSDQSKVFWLLSGLGPQYESFATAMLKPPVPSYSDLIPLLQSHELRNKGHESNPTNHSMAFISQRYGGGNKNTNRKNAGQFFTSKGKGFHQSRPGSQPHREGNDTSSQHATRPQQNKTEAYIPTCQICKKRGHDALKCWHRFDNSYQAEDIPQALAAMQLESAQDEEWFPDTGATAHMTKDAGKLVNLKPYKGSDSVIVANGDKLNISHIGETRITNGKSSIPLREVLLVPNIQQNLLSVSQLTNDYPCQFEFRNDGFEIKDLKTKQVLASGSKHGGLYVFNKPKVQAFFSRRFRIADEDVWHRRLGHPQAKVLRYLVSNNLISINKKSSNLCTNLTFPTVEPQVPAAASSADLDRGKGVAS